MKKAIAIAAMLLLSACSTKTDFSAMEDGEIFDIGLKRLASERHEEAAEAFRHVELAHPYSDLLMRSFKLQGFALYRERRYFDAIEVFQKILRYDPMGEHAPYAMYMIALSYYDQISPITREQRMTQMALTAMEALVEKFPESEYAGDVKPKITIARNMLAAKEMFTARALVRGKNIVAALNRYQTVIVKFESTLFVPEALFRAAEIYGMMGADEDARNMIVVLRLNFPDSEWTARSVRIVP